MDVQLELLIRLQQVDIKITHLQETISALPSNLRSLEEKLQQQKVALEQADKGGSERRGTAQKTGKRS